MAVQETVDTVRRVEAALEEMILNGDYGPGQRINENATAARLGVGRTPVREACRLLERAGLVRIIPHQGAIVASLTLHEVVQLFDVRAALGRLAGSEAAASMDDAHLKSLRYLLVQLDKAASERNAEQYIELNIEFHSCLYEATGNSRLAALDHSIGKELRVYRQHGLARGGGLAVSNQEHRLIVAAVERGDREEAGIQLFQHIQNGRDRFLRAMSATGKIILNTEATKTT